MDSQSNGSYPGKLTRRDIEVLNLLSEGIDNRAIAATLALSIKTVEMRLSAIYTKLGVKNRLQAAIWYITHS